MPRRQPSLSPLRCRPGARGYRYRLAHYTAAGRELLTLEVDGARVHHRDKLEMEETRVAFEKERARHADPESVRIGVNTAVPAILDLTEGVDGSIYLLTAGVADPGEGKTTPWSLDRFNPLTGTLERTPLAFHYPGALSLAAGKDDLYVVRFNGEKKRVMLPWEAIEAAEWTAVEGVVVDGWEVEVGVSPTARDRSSASQPGPG